MTSVPVIMIIITLSFTAGSPPEFIIKSETDNEAWIATLQSIEPGSGSQHQVSAPSSAASPTNNSASQSPCPPAALGDSPAIVSSVQKRMHESKNATPPASQVRLNLGISHIGKVDESNV